LVTGSAVAWSTAGLFTRAIGVETWAMLVWRGVFGALGILAVTLLLQGPRGLAGFARLGWSGWIFAVISALGMLCFINALRITTVAHVSIIYATVPLVAAGLAWGAMRERPGRRAIIASLVSLAGVAVMVGLGVEGDPWGDLLAFGMTAALAVMMVISRRYPGIPTMQAAALSALLSGLVAVPMSGGIALGTGDIGMLALFGVVNSAIGLSLFTLGAKMLPSVQVALIGALDAPLAPIWVWLVFAEVPGRETLLGGGIVFAAVGWFLLGGRRGRTG
jgi:drug/metabolite transporter (DMT)-like permease